MWMMEYIIDKQIFKVKFPNQEEMIKSEKIMNIVGIVNYSYQLGDGR